MDDSDKTRRNLMVAATSVAIVAILEVKTLSLVGITANIEPGSPRPWIVAIAIVAYFMFRFWVNPTVIKHREESHLYSLKVQDKTLQNKLNAGLYDMLQHSCHYSFTIVKISESDIPKATSRTFWKIADDFYADKSHEKQIVFFASPVDQQHKRTYYIQPRNNNKVSEILKVDLPQSSGQFMEMNLRFPALVSTYTEALFADPAIKWNLMESLLPILAGAAAICLAFYRIWA